MRAVRHTAPHGGHHHRRSCRPAGLGDELDRLLADAKASQRYLDTICVDDDAHLVLPPGQPLHYGNHSCDPNMWHTDAYTLATRRDIRAGEELTVEQIARTSPAQSAMVRPGWGAEPP